MKVVLKKSLSFFMSLTLLLGLIGVPTMVVKASVFKDGITSFEQNQMGRCPDIVGLAENEVKAEVNGYKFRALTESDKKDSYFGIYDKTLGSETVRCLILDCGDESVNYKELQISLTNGNSMNLSSIEVAAYEVMGDTVNFTITGYKDGVLVPNAEYTTSEEGSINGKIIKINVSEMREFKNIDSFTITPGPHVVLNRSIIIKSINANEIPNSGNPGTGEPGTGEPGTGEPGTGEPGTGEPGTGNPGTSDPDPAWNLLKVQIETYQGGSGEFSANLNKEESTVTVTGKVTQANIPLALTIPAGVKVIWKAELEGTLAQGSLIESNGPGEFVLAQDGHLVSNGGTATITMPYDHSSVTIDGGMIHSSSMTGVFGNGEDNEIVILNGAVSANNGNAISNMGRHSTTWVNGGEVSTTSEGKSAIISQGLIKVSRGFVFNTNGTAILTMGNVIVEGTGIVWSRNGITINILESTAVLLLDKGIVISYYDTDKNYDAIKVISEENVLTGPKSTVIKWDMTSGKTEYVVGTKTDIINQYGQSEASWESYDNVLGISVDIGDFRYFFSIPGLKVATEPGLAKVESIKVGELPTKTEYKLGDILDLSGLVITINYSNGSTVNVPHTELEDKDITVTPGDGSIIDAEMTNLEITYDDGQVKKTVFQPLTINTNTGNSIVIKNSEHGTASANIMTAELGTEITLTAIPDNGYKLLYWEIIEGNISIIDKTFIMPNETVILRGIFGVDNEAKVYHKLVFHYNEEANVDRLVLHGTKIEDEMWPEGFTQTGFTFGGWFTSADGTGAEFTKESVVTNAAIYYAKWIPEITNGGSNGNGGTGGNGSSGDNGSSGGNGGTGGNGSSGGNTPPVNEAPPTTGTTPSSVEQITVDVKEGSSDSVASQISIHRTTNQNGQKSDKVTYDTNKAIETLNKLINKGQDTARIVIPDSKDEVSETTVNIPVASMKTLAEGKINLQIDTEEAKIFLSKDSLNKISSGLIDELYFHLVPVKDEAAKVAVSDQAKLSANRISNHTNSTVTIVGNPITIETNMPSAETDIILPLTGVIIPDSAAERESLLKELAVYIEHSDGDKELVQGKLVEYKAGEYGIRFHINKFSTFTIVKTNAFLQTTNKDITKFTTPRNAVITGTNITASVANSVDSITVKATVRDQATYKVYLDKELKKVATNNKLTLKTGVNTSYIKVTAQDKSTKVYKLSITRNKNWKAEITKLTMPEKAVIKGKTITATVPNDQDSLTVKALVSGNANYKLYSDKGLKKAIKNNKLNLSVGTNIVYVKVTAENEKSTKVYTLTITRKAQAYNTQVRLGVIGSKSYSEKVTKIFEKEYDTANVIMKQVGKYYLVTMDFKNTTAANKACQDMIRREYIIHYYLK